MSIKTIHEIRFKYKNIHKLELPKVMKILENHGF
jgi:hypothetical protein